MKYIKVVGLFALMLVFLAACSVGDKKILTKESTQEDVDNAVSQVEALENLVSGVTNDTNNTNDAMDTSNEERTVVVMKTSLGDITLELFNDISPNTVENFVKLSEDGFYDGILFHRVIPDFMIQAGDPNTKTDPTNWNIHGTGGPGYKFADEFNNQPLVRGSLAMANSGPNTNGSQFFIVTAPATPWLDGRHTNFGQVIAGLDVVDAIVSVDRNPNDHPLKDVKILSIDVQ